MTIGMYIIGMALIVGTLIICGTMYSYWKVHIKGCKHNTLNAFEHT